ncbi:MAG: NADPH-dependent oxidoreductase, partial [Proteobacteria bacterium]|nr:NADPH-dependent oxidoreductase [Pseudomonadota bacterium]
AEVSGKDDEFIRRRIDFAFKILAAYGAALKPVRDSGVTFEKEFANGM